MKNKIILSLAMLSALVLSGCKDKKVDAPNNFEGLYYDERTTDREYIERVASTILGFISANDQREATTALNAFVKRCEEYQLPDNFRDDPYADMAKAAAEMARCIDDNDYTSVSRAATAFVYNMARFQGLYQASPGSDAWVKIEDRGEIMFRYWIGESDYNVSVTGLGGTWDATGTDSGNQYLFEVPKSLNLLLTKGVPTNNSSSLITLKVTSDGKDNDHLTVKTSLRYANIQVEASLKANNSTINEVVDVYIHNTKSMVRNMIISSTTDILGSGLCSIRAWQDAAYQSDDAVSRMVRSVNSTLMLYSSVQIKSVVNDVKTFIDNADCWYDGSDTPNPKALAENSAKALSAAVKAEVRYCSDKTQKVRGTLGWEPYLYDDWYGSEEWSVRPTITFTSDGATYDFESYFGNGRFLSVEKTIKNLINTYKGYWK